MEGNHTRTVEWIINFDLFLVLAKGQADFKCPDDYGFYPHSTSCDKYWKCDNGIAELKTCGNGLAFDASDSKYLTENCDYLHNVDCGDRTNLGKTIERQIKKKKFSCISFTIEGHVVATPSTNDAFSELSNPLLY